jgi:hypothetical protein
MNVLVFLGRNGTRRTALTGLNVQRREQMKPIENRRLSQAERILWMLRTARAENRAVGVPELMAADVAHFTARIFELRRRGFVIDNKVGRSDGGQLRSLYRLVHDPQRDDDE